MQQFCVVQGLVIPSESNLGDDVHLEMLGNISFKCWSPRIKITLFDLLCLTLFAANTKNAKQMCILIYFGDRRRYVVECGGSNQGS